MSKAAIVWGLPGKASGSSAFSAGSHAAGGFALTSPSLASCWLIRPVANCPVLTCRSQLKTLLLTQDTSEAAQLQSTVWGGEDHEKEEKAQLSEQNERDRGKMNIFGTAAPRRGRFLQAATAQLHQLKAKPSQSI